ncbi:MAG: hypothetical protein QXF24_09580 [Thermoproteota archaeon]
MQWLSGCEGCEVALLDSFEALLEKIKEGKAEVVYAPLLLDAKDYESADIAIVTGSLRTEADERRLRRAREKSKCLLAFGSCACFGGMHGLADLEGVGGKGGPGFWLRDSVDPVWRAAKVDLAVPGCPPPEKKVKLLLENVLSPADEKQGRSVCDECGRKRSGERKIAKFRRGLKGVDEERCFLDQGVPCIGFATSSGCGALCPSVNYPCYGCMGFNGGVAEQDEGVARAISALASSLELENVEGGLADPVGFFMRFAYPCFSLKGGKGNGSGGR